VTDGFGVSPPAGLTAGLGPVDESPGRFFAYQLELIMDYALEFRRQLILSANDHHTQHQYIDSLSEKLADDLRQKRHKAVSWLGSMWCLHPLYEASSHRHHNSGVKHSITLSKFLHERGAVEAGRV